MTPIISLLVVLVQGRVACMVIIPEDMFCVAMYVCRGLSGRERLPSTQPLEEIRKALASEHKPFRISKNFYRSCMQEKGWQSSTPSSQTLKSLLIAKLKQKLKERVQASLSSTCEVSDDETPAASPKVPAQPAMEAASVPQASVTEVRGGKCQDDDDELLTRTMQLQLAQSKKRKKFVQESDEEDAGDSKKPRTRPGKLRRSCLSKQSLALARHRSEPKNPKKAKAKAQPKKPSNTQTKGATPKCQGKGESLCQGQGEGWARNPWPRRDSEVSWPEVPPGQGRELLCRCSEGSARHSKKGNSCLQQVPWFVIVHIVSIVVPFWGNLIYRIL